MTLLAVALAGRGLVDPQGPVFPADDEAVVRGSCGFETLRVYGGRPFLLAEHLHRLRHSCGQLALEPPDGVEEVIATVSGAAPPDFVLRIYRTSTTIVATAAEIPASLEAERANGLKLRTFEVGAPPPFLGGAKATSYGSSFAAKREAEQLGADDAILVGEGLVLEATTANVWWRRGEELYTPTTRPGVLPGVTRGLICSIQDVIEGAYTVEDLLAADEAFLTSSVREVMPVVEVDGSPIGSGSPGLAAARLQAALRLRSSG
jgi:branched-subunit amino acid aminotransferase/4-amino-4-deoxychorismate lyase